MDSEGIRSDGSQQEAGNGSSSSDSLLNFRFGLQQFLWALLPAPPPFLAKAKSPCRKSSVTTHIA